MLRGYLGKIVNQSPKKNSCTIFTGGCNFKCPFCCYPRLVNNHLSIEKTPIDELIINLKYRAKDINEIVFAGGDPFIHDKLFAILKRIKRMNKSIKITTNGYFPNLLEQALDSGLIDTVLMDIKTSLPKYPDAVGCTLDISRIKASIDIIMKKAPVYEFRTTVVPGFVEERDILQIAELLDGATHYSLYPLSSRKLLKPEYRKILPKTKAYLKNYAEIASRKIGSVTIKKF